MISSLKGEIVQKAENYLVIQIGGVGFQVYVPAVIISRSDIGDQLNLYTNLVVRENSLSLYGFDNKENCDLFQQLLNVSGIGPRLGLVILSTLSSEMIYQAILGQKPEIFDQVPGVGKKTAQKIVLFLQDRLKGMLERGMISAVRDTDNDLLEALVGLGYSVVEAQSAVQSLPKDIPDELEEKIRLALRYFSS